MLIGLVVMMSAIGVVSMLPSARPSAQNRTTMSRSVTTPSRCSPRTIGMKPQSSRRIITATSLMVVDGSARVIVFAIASRTCMAVSSRADGRLARPMHPVPHGPFASRRP